ncbi:hypothetical protein [Sphingomonas faeni]|nr:hypothetical protein [Sphingomonas faeni]
MIDVAHGLNDTRIFGIVAMVTIFAGIAAYQGIIDRSNGAATGDG